LRKGTISEFSDFYSTISLQCWTSSTEAVYMGVGSGDRGHPWIFIHCTIK